MKAHLIRTLEEWEKPSRVIRDVTKKSDSRSMAKCAPHTIDLTEEKKKFHSLDKYFACV